MVYSIRSFDKCIFLRLFLEKRWEKFWWFRKKSYLCIRFQGTTPDEHQKKEFFERFT